jgi:hypothetical protein
LADSAWIWCTASSTTIPRSPRSSSRRRHRPWRRRARSETWLG